MSGTLARRLIDIADNPNGDALRELRHIAAHVKRLELFADEVVGDAADDARLEAVAARRAGLRVVR